MNRYVLPLVAVGALLVFLVMGLRHGDPRALPSPFIGKPAPEFELPTLKNPEVSIGKQHMLGGYSLVNVWATWCVMCRAEHPFLMELAASKAIPIYGINWRERRRRFSSIRTAPSYTSISGHSTPGYGSANSSRA